MDYTIKRKRTYCWYKNFHCISLASAETIFFFNCRQKRKKTPERCFVEIFCKRVNIIIFKPITLLEQKIYSNIVRYFLKTN